MVNPQEKTMKIDRLHRHPIRRIARAMGLLGTGMFILILAACDSTPLPTDVSGQTASDAEMDDQLEALRRATARYVIFDEAHADGYSTQLTECFSDPQDGGMGFHYGNGTLIDGRVEVTAPEVLLYERELSGEMRLVGVEYIVPFGISGEPPVLFDQVFVPNEAFGLWTLHVWVHKSNPRGMFAPWNPNVSCH